jgi:hypothetical protein
VGRRSETPRCKRSCGRRSGAGGGRRPGGLITASPGVRREMWRPTGRCGWGCRCGPAPRGRPRARASWSGCRGWARPGPSRTPASVRRKGNAGGSRWTTSSGPRPAVARDGVGWGRIPAWPSGGGRTVGPGSGGRGTARRCGSTGPARPCPGG